MSSALVSTHVSARRTNNYSFLRSSRRLMLTGIDSVAGWLSGWLIGRRRRKSGPRPGDPLHSNRVRLDLDRFEERAYPGSIQGWTWAGLVGANVALVDERLVDPARDVDRYWELVKSQAEDARPASRFAIETDPTPKSTESTEAKSTSYRGYESAERRAPERPELRRTGENALTDDVFADPLANEWLSNVPRRGPVRVQGTETSASAANMESASGGGSFASVNRSGESNAGLSPLRTLDRLPLIPAIEGSRGNTSAPADTTNEPRVVLSRPTTFESRDEPTRTPCASTATCLYIFDARKGVVTPNGLKQHAFSTWPMELHAELVGAKASATGGYSWSFSDPSKVTPTTITGNKLTFTWASFTTSPAHETTLTATVNYPTGQSISQTIPFIVEGTDSPAYSAEPTTPATWPSVVPPDAIKPGEQLFGNGPYYDLSATSGELRTSHMLPGFNPGVAPLGLTYSSNTAVVSSESLGAADGPIFIVHYQIPSGSGAFNSVSARLTFNGVSGPTFSYNTSTLDVGELMQIALQPDVSGLSTGRYNYTITVSASYSPGDISLLNGKINYVSYASSAFGAGWSLDELERLHTVTGTSAGVILDKGGGYSLWFASTTTAGIYATPEGDFSTLTQQTSTPFRFSRTLVDGTVITYNSSGYETRREVPTGMVTSYTYDGSNQLTAVKVDEDFGTLVTTLAYSSGKVTSITDPASRVTTLAYDGSGRLTRIQDPDSATFTYAYDAANRLTGLTNPRTHTTTFDYNFASRVTGVTRPNSSTESLTALQLRGLAESATATLTPVLVADAQSTYTDPRGQNWNTRSDWKGYGYTTHDEDPLQNINLAYRDANGLAWLESNPLGFRTRSLFDAKGNPTKVVLPNDSFHQYGYNSFSQVTSHTDRGTHTTTYAYDSGGRLTRMTDALNQITTYTNTNAGFVSTVTDPLTNTTTYHYDSRSRLTQMIDALSKTISYGYDSASNLTSLTDQNINTTTYGYDAMGRMTKMVLPGSSTAVYTYAYDAAGNLTAEIVPVTAGTSLVTSYAYDTLNRITTITDPLTQVTTLAYDGLNNVTGTTHGISTLVTSYSYDNAGRGTKVTDPLGHAITYAYDDAGQITRVEQQLFDGGHRSHDTAVSLYTYNAMGQMDIATDPGGEEVQSIYDEDGNLVACECIEVVRSTHATTFAYDALHRLTSVTTPLDFVTTLAYDAVGNRTRVAETAVSGSTLVTTYAYDAVYRLSSVTNGDTATTLTSMSYAYDAVGNLTRVFDGLGNAPTYAYDARNRVTASTIPTAAGTSVTTFAYDLASRPTALTDSVNNTTSYFYNAASRVTRRTDPLGNPTTYAYDAANRLTSMIDRNGRQRDFGYDAASRLTTEKWISGVTDIRTFTYAYDFASRLTVANDPDAAYTFGYDLAGNRTQAIVADGIGTQATFPTFTLNYSYGDHYNLTSLSDGSNGSITYGYDKLNRMTQASMRVGTLNGPLVTFGYDNADRMTKIVRNATNTVGTNFAVTSSYGYDSADRLTNLSHSWVSGSDTFTYAYDAASRVTQYTSSRAAEGTITYAYDASAQLTNVTSTNYSETFTYDTNGNRTMTGYQTGTGNRLTADGTYTYAYDNEGNLTSKTGTSLQHTFTWDYRNRLSKVVAVESGQTTTVTFTYDAFDRRIGKLVGTAQQWTVYNGDNPYADFNGTTASASLSYRYLYGDRIDFLLARYDGTSSNTAVAWYITDNLDSVRRIVQTTGNTAYEVNYKAFGDVRSGSTGTGDRFEFAAREFDGEFNHFFYRSRYYDPTVGRFTREDPLEYQAQDSNLYRYVFNSPTNFTDPTGQFIIPLIIIGALAVGAAAVGWISGANPGEQGGGAAGGAVGAAVAGGVFIVACFVVSAPVSIPVLALTCVAGGIYGRVVGKDAGAGQPTAGGGASEAVQTPPIYIIPGLLGLGIAANYLIWWYGAGRPPF